VADCELISDSILEFFSSLSSNGVEFIKLENDSSKNVKPIAEILKTNTMPIPMIMGKPIRIF
jgi:hypothetical protein